MLSLPIECFLHIPDKNEFKDVKQSSSVLLELQTGLVNKLVQYVQLSVIFR